MSSKVDVDLPLVAVTARRVGELCLGPLERGLPSRGRVGLVAAGAEREHRQHGDRQRLRCGRGARRRGSAVSAAGGTVVRGLSRQVGVLVVTADTGDARDETAPDCPEYQE